MTVVLTISRLYPGKDVVCNDITSIVSQLGASAFQVREIVLDAVLKALEAFWQAFIERLTNLVVAIIDREMAKQMVFKVVDGIELDKVDADGVMEIFKVNAET